MKTDYSFNKKSILIFLLVVAVLILMFLIIGYVYKYIYRAPDQKPVITEFTVSPEIPVVGQMVVISVSARDDKGIRGFELDLGVRELQFDCNGQRSCSKQLTHTIPDITADKIILKLTVTDTANQETMEQKDVTVIHEPPPTVCGDGDCESGESCSSCPEDCGECPPVCGDGDCEAGEDCENCPADCGDCPVVTTNKHFGVDAAVLSDDDVPGAVAELGDGISGYNGMCYWEHDSVKTNKEIQDLDLAYNSYKAAGRTLQVNLLNCDQPAEGRTDTKFPDNLDDYAAWVKNIVNRYKGDIIYYQIDSEPNTGAFSGTKEQFVQLLNVAYDSAKEVDPNVKIMCCGWAVADLFVDDPSDAEITAMINRNQKYRAAFDFAEYVIQNGKYDIVTVHANNYYNSIPGIVNWVRKYTNKPIMFDDMVSAPNSKGTFHDPPLYYQEYAGYYDILDTGSSHPQYEEIKAIVEAEQSRVTVKKSVTAFTSGVEKVFLTWTADLPGYTIATFRHCGLIHTLEERKKPVFYTYKIMISKIDGFDSAEKVRDEIHKFTVNNKPVIVAWSDSGERTIDLSPYFSGSDVKVTHIITEQGKTDTDALTETVPASSITIDETPIFVEKL